MELKSFVGKTFGPYVEEVPAQRLSAFARSVGAQDTGMAPPTFLTVCRRGEFEAFQAAQVPMSRLLHGEQEYTYHSPIHAGEQIRYETKLANVLEKRGSASPMQILIFETQVQAGRDGEMRLAGVSKSTIIVRGGA